MKKILTASLLLIPAFFLGACNMDGSPKPESLVHNSDLTANEWVFEKANDEEGADTGEAPIVASFTDETMTLKAAPDATKEELDSEMKEYGSDYAKYSEEFLNGKTYTYHFTRDKNDEFISYTNDGGFYPIKGQASISKRDNMEEYDDRILLSADGSGFYLFNADK